MKGLLHSKLFRKNLFTWLFMYIGIMGLFTTVVTYSKYISSMQNADGARVASFKANITFDGVCSSIGEGFCNIGSYRPTTSGLEYYFTVDNTEIEVSAKFVTIITVRERFENIQVYDITDSEPRLVEFIANDNVYTLTENLNAGDTYIRKYKVTLDYDYETYGISTSTDHLALEVGYEATQIK